MSYSDPNFNYALILAFSFVIIVAVASLYVDSPFGKFSSTKMGFNLNPRLGWLLMELPASFSFYFFYFSGSKALEPVPLFFLFLWSCHYLNRGFIFPFLLRSTSATFSISVIVSGWLVTFLHGYLNATYLTSVGTHFDSSWFGDIRFLGGVILYYFGFYTNIKSDYLIRNLRSIEEVTLGKKVYRIPYGGMFRYISNPSYFGELVAWLGFALATWSPGGLFIFLISCANLIPRAVKTHKWYQGKFIDYPKNRKILVPFIY